jgi:2-polyprenyl-3-methyl-5-hydroxy-6-metoxy-1,4-benzoquinol methylase
MTDRLTTSLLACPSCAADMSGPWGERSDGRIACSNGHSFPVVSGIPRLFRALEDVDACSIKESFSSEWSAFRHGQDRPWGQSIDHRREIALRELDCEPSWLEGRLVLDAGCGAGKLSWILAHWGADVVAADISRSVDEARRAVLGSEHGRIKFVQTDLNQPPLKAGSFDLVFSGGVLHHNRDTRESLNAIAPLVAPGGSIYVWLYKSTPGLAHKVRGVARRAITPLPSHVQRAIFHPWTAQSMLRQHLRVRTGRAREDDIGTYREKFVTLLDHYTPRYRWEHTAEELSGWYRELGFENVRVTETGRHGFGVLATRPSDRAAETPTLAFIGA